VIRREAVVWIEGPRGTMPGVVHYPATTRPALNCVIMLSGGQINRVGPQRLYVNAARHWADNGLMCLRLDLAGVGEHPAENDARHFDGHLPEEAVAAVDYAIDELGATSVHLQGLCAGARVALKGAAQCDRVNGVLAWSCPVLSTAPGLPTSPYEDAHAISGWAARETVLSIVRAVIRVRLLSPSWWGNRFRRGGTEARQVVRSVIRMSRGTPASHNPFLDAVDDLLRDGRNMLFLFGQRDAMPLGEFRERFASIPEGVELAQGFCVIPEGTHTFSTVQSQRAVIELSTTWLLDRLLHAASGSGTS
jgi:pimeloyl-ACP methyl ester carboxylesterase